MTIRFGARLSADTVILLGFHQTSIRDLDTIVRVIIYNIICIIIYVCTKHRSCKLMIVFSQTRDDKTSGDRERERKWLKKPPRRYLLFRGSRPLEKIK